MILNPNKSHYMYIGRNTENDIFKFENVCIDNKFTFDSHIKITG